MKHVQEKGESAIGVRRKENAPRRKKKKEKISCKRRIKMNGS